jgi:hypothetical protein
VHTIWPAMLLLASCFRVTSRPTCEFDPEEVGDDVEVAGATGAGLLGQVEGTEGVSGTYEDDAAAEVTIEVVRAGSAEWVHATPASDTTRSFGFGRGSVDLYAPAGTSCGCRSRSRSRPRTRGWTSPWWRPQTGPWRTRASGSPMGS